MCPARAVQLDGKQIRMDEEKCIHCGICLRVCPEKIFRSNYLDETINAKVKLILQNNFPVVVECGHSKTHFRKGKSFPVIRVGCLASLHPEQIALWAMQGAAEIWLNTIGCAECSVNGRSLLLETVTQTSTFLDHINCSCRIRYELPPQQPVTERWTSQDETEPMNRRDFFARIKRELGKGIVNFIDKTQDVLEIKELPEKRSVVEIIFQKGTIPHRIEFLEALKMSGIYGITGMPDNSPWGSVERSGVCSNCRVCSTLCWSGAVIREELGNSIKLIWDGSKCNNCGYCILACPEEVLVMTRDWSFSEQKSI